MAGHVQAGTSARNQVYGRRFNAIEGGDSCFNSLDAVPAGEALKGERPPDGGSGVWRFNGGDPDGGRRLVWVGCG